MILRENTERPETIDVWWAILVWNCKERIVYAYKQLEKKVVNWYNPFWDGKTAENIFKLIRSNEKNNF